jgi:thymidylate kinase
MTALRIALEGLDGCGKSTLCQYLASTYCYDVLPTPLPALKMFRETIDACLDPSPLARVAYYTANVHRAGDIAKEYVDHGHTIVLDRYWLSTRVYGAMQATEFPYDAHEKILAPMDFTFFLHVPLEERQRRMQSRSRLEAHDRMTLNPETAEKIRELYLDYGRNSIHGRFIDLDCAGLSVAQLADCIHQHLKQETLV